MEPRRHQQAPAARQQQQQQQQRRAAALAALFPPPGNNTWLRACARGQFNRITEHFTFILARCVASDRMKGRLGALFATRALRSSSFNLSAADW